jgi:hypothetical protein
MEVVKSFFYLKETRCAADMNGDCDGEGDAAALEICWGRGICALDIKNNLSSRIVLGNCLCALAHCIYF